MGVEPVSPVLAGRLLTTSTTWEVSNTSKPAPTLMIQIDRVLEGLTLQVREQGM